LTLDEMCEAVWRALLIGQKKSTFTPGDIHWWARDAAEKMGFSVPGRDDDARDHWGRDRGPVPFVFDQVVWQLILEGVLAPTLPVGSSICAMSELRLTDYGQAVLSETQPTPHDPTGYLAGLRATVPDLDDVVLEYLDEALKAFRHGCLRAAVVMTGCANERLGLVLAEALVGAGIEAKALSELRTEVAKKPEMQFKQRMDLVHAALRGINRPPEFRLPLAAKQAIDDVPRIIETIRQVRNEHGHPTSVTVTRWGASMGLMLFPQLCKNVYAVIGWLEEQTAPVE
jgi:hypothetical protein